MQGDGTGGFEVEGPFSVGERVNVNGGLGVVQ
jgi:hypothetical protein